MPTIQISILLFCALYFFQMGGLHTKHVRYLLPMLPFLLLLTAQLCIELERQKRRAGQAIGAVLSAAALTYGLAFTTIYSREDSRVSAARWAPGGPSRSASASSFELP